MLFFRTKSAFRQPGTTLTLLARLCCSTALSTYQLSSGVLLQDDKKREKEVEQMRAALDQMQAANQDRQQKQQSAEATLTALKVVCHTLRHVQFAACVSDKSFLL